VGLSPTGTTSPFHGAHPKPKFSKDDSVGRYRS
jgi:hypothetical protein